ncbi:hypothetical protein RugamoR64_33780 [Duganella rhizosphaerae]
MDVLEVGEQVCATCIRRNKAEALGVVEPFDDTGLLSAHEFSFNDKNIGDIAMQALGTKKLKPKEIKLDGLV